MKGMTPDKAVFDKHIETLTAKLDGYDRILAKQRYLAGDVRISWPLNSVMFSLTLFSCCLGSDAGRSLPPPIRFDAVQGW